MRKEEDDAVVARNSSCTMTAIIYCGIDFLCILLLNLPRYSDLFIVVFMPIIRIELVSNEGFETNRYKMYIN